jgi:hypothetical protein
MALAYVESQTIALPAYGFGAYSKPQYLILTQAISYATIL